MLGLPLSAAVLHGLSSRMAAWTRWQHLVGLCSLRVQWQLLSRWLSTSAKDSGELWPDYSASTAHPAAFWPARVLMVWHPSLKRFVCFVIVVQWRRSHSFLRVWVTFRFPSFLFSFFFYSTVVLLQNPFLWKLQGNFKCDSCNYFAFSLPSIFPNISKC